MLPIELIFASHQEERTSGKNDGVLLVDAGYALRCLLEPMATPHTPEREEIAYNPFNIKMRFRIRQAFSVGLSQLRKDSGFPDNHRGPGFNFARDCRGRLR